jgi:hypothetical protein
MSKPGKNVTPGKNAPPSLLRQKQYIIDNADHLSERIRMTIFKLVMQEVGSTYENKKENRTDYVVMDHKGSKMVSINLDVIPDPGIITHIYNIVKRHIAVMNEPAQSGSR